MSTSSSQNRVFVLDANKQPLMPCHPARARELLGKGKAAVYRRYPFTIILKDRVGGELQPLRLKSDPGARTTGLALVASFKRGPRCIWAAELAHRGSEIKKHMAQRRGIRRSRRHRHTRYRKPRFNNRTRKPGWLPPSLQSRVENITSWTTRLRGFAPLTALSMELVRFDTQKLQNPEISGVEYQQGELMGYELREYLLEKWGRQCAYCKKKNIPLQIEHIYPRSKGGSDRVSNLTLACEKCNQKKGNKDVSEFLKRKPERFKSILAVAKAPLTDAAAVNATRCALLEALKRTGLPVETGSGGRTKYNRSKQGYRKEHWLDAVCVGESGAKVFVEQDKQLLYIKAMGRGSRQMCRVDQYGFPRTGPKGAKRVQGFQTGDVVVAMVLTGKKQGRYEGRVAIRATGSFNIKTKAQTVQGLGYKSCRLVQRADGYFYSY